MLRSLKFAPVLIGVALGTPGSVHGQQPPPRRAQPIIFAEPRSTTATSNFNEIATQMPVFQTPGKELKKPSDIFDSGEGFTTPSMPQLPRPKVSSKRLKEFLDKGNNRGLQTPEELATEMTAEAIFKIPEFDRDGQDKKKKTWMERGYDRLEREHLGTTNQMKGEDLLGQKEEHEGRDERTPLGTEKPSDMTGQIKALTWKPLLGEDSSSALNPDLNKSGSLSDGFGFANVEAPVESPEAARARETRWQNYRQLLDSGALSPPVPASPALNFFKNAPAPTHDLSPSQGLDAFPGTSPRISWPTAPVSAPLGFPGSFGNSQSLTPPPPRTLPPAPTFELPKRKF